MISRAVRIFYDNDGKELADEVSRNLKSYYLVNFFSSDKLDGDKWPCRDAKGKYFDKLIIIITDSFISSKSFKNLYDQCQIAGNFHRLSDETACVPSFFLVAHNYSNLTFDVIPIKNAVSAIQLKDLHSELNNKRVRLHQIQFVFETRYSDFSYQLHLESGKSIELSSTAREMLIDYVPLDENITAVTIKTADSKADFQVTHYLPQLNIQYIYYFDGNLNRYSCLVKPTTVLANSTMTFNVQSTKLKPSSDSLIRSSSFHKQIPTLFSLNSIHTSIFETKQTIKNQIEDKRQSMNVLSSKQTRSAYELQLETENLNLKKSLNDIQLEMFNKEKEYAHTIQTYKVLLIDFEIAIPNRLSFQIDPAHLTINKQHRLGKGSFGKVYAGTYYKLPVDIKKLKEEIDLKQFQHEVHTLMKLKHSYVVSCFGCTIEKPCIVMELMPKGSLYKWISTQESSIDNVVIYRLLTEISLGMHYLHSQSPMIIHRDLKSPNILLDNDLHAKISDFGLAKTREHSATQTAKDVMGTVSWSAPEYLTFSRIKERNEKGDIFSFGVITWELLTREIPWQSSGMLLRDIEQAVVSGHRLDIPKNCPKSLEKMIQMCWKNDPRSRPAFEDIIGMLEGTKEEANWTDSEQRDMKNFKKKLAQQ